jgi:hypothetical protein
MAVAIVSDWKAEDRSTAAYDRLVELMRAREDPPAGLIFHSAGFADDATWRVFDVWETQEDADRFIQERLMPAMGQLPPEAGGGPPDAVSAYEVHGYQVGST